MSDKKQRLNVTCPCCQAALILEPSTGLVISSQRKAVDYSLEEAVKAETARKSQADALFEKAFADEEKRHKSLEERFEKALEASDELDDPVRPWDYE